MSKFFYFKGSSNQLKPTEEREHPFTSFEITYRFEKTSAVIWADLCSLWIWHFFFTPIPWKWTSAGPHCAAVRDFIPQHGSLACYKFPPFSQRGLYQVSAISFIMHIWLIKRPHVALHKNSCSRPLSPRIVSQQSRPVETPNGRIVAVLRKEFVCECHASNCRGDIAATS